MADLRPRRAAGRGRLVDGGLGAFSAGRGFAISTGDPSGAGAADLCRHRLDAAAVERANTVYGAVTTENHQHDPAGADLRAALFRRAGGGLACGPGLQHLARYRRRVHSVGGAAVVRSALVAQSLRQSPYPAIPTLPA